MAKVKIQDIEVTRGDDEAFLLRFTQSVQGSTFFFTAKRNYTDSDTAAVVKTQATALGPDYLEVLLSVPHSQTSGLSQRTYYYDIQWVDPSGSVRTVVKGKLVVELDVTLRTS